MKIIHYDWNLTSDSPFDLHLQSFSHADRHSIVDLHQSLHVNIILEGSMRGRLGDTEVVLGKDDLQLTAPWELHGDIVNEGPLVLLSITVDPNLLLGNLLAFQDKARLLLLMPPQERHGILAAAPVHDLARRWAAELLRLRHQSPALLRIQRWLCIQRYFAELLWLIPDRRLPSTSAQALQRIMPALELAAHRPAVTVGLAAKACGLSPGRFSQLFRQACGGSFAVHAMRIRLSRAALALREGQTLKSIAMQEGFCDASHLARQFRRQFGMPPKAWCRRQPEQP